MKDVFFLVFLALLLAGSKLPWARDDSDAQQGRSSEANAPPRTSQN